MSRFEVSRILEMAERSASIEGISSAESAPLLLFLGPVHLHVHARPAPQTPIADQLAEPAPKKRRRRRKS